MEELRLTGRGPNTMSLDSVSAFLERMDSVGDQPLLVTGEGDAFSAGLDLDALPDTDPHQLLEAMEEVTRRLFLHPAPTVACVNGHAVAGGCLLAIACDHRVVADDDSLRMGMPGVAIGLAYPPLVVRVLRARLPRHTIERVLLGAELFGPREALALGVVDEVAADPLAVARERLAARAAHPRHAYAEAKRALREPEARVTEEERAAYLERVLPAWSAEELRTRLRNRR